MVSFDAATVLCIVLCCIVLCGALRCVALRLLRLLAILGCETYYYYYFGFLGDLFTTSKLVADCLGSKVLGSR